MPTNTKHPIRKRHRNLAELVSIERKKRPNDGLGSAEAVAQMFADFEGAPVKRKRKYTHAP